METITAGELVQVIQVVDKGLLEDPEVFITEDDAGLYFEKLARGDKFRGIRKGESWELYCEAHMEYQQSPEYTSDPDTYELHWFIQTIQ